MCVDAYEYFGTDDRYIAYLSGFLRPGGQVEVSVPATVTELNGQVPDHLGEARDWEFHAWHSTDWWRRQWAKTGKVEVERADLVPDGWAYWMRWEETMAEVGGGHSESPAALGRAIADDAGRTFGFARLVTRRP